MQVPQLRKATNDLLARTKDDQWVPTLFIIVFTLAFAICLAIVAFRSLSTTEALLFSLLMTLFSTIASWLASRRYSDFSFNANLRTFGLKAAEKVSNLSNELDRLAVFLQSSNPAEDDESALVTHELRTEAAIHIINTLKSVNDKSLSDWQGVIGDEINAQRQQQKQREEELEELLERFESISNSQLETQKTSQERSTSALRTELDSLKREIRILMSQIGGVSARRPISASPKTREMEMSCHECGNPLQYTQKCKKKNSKLVKCHKCGTCYVSSFDGTQLQVFKRQEVAETIECPTCRNSLKIELDNAPSGRPYVRNCPVCNHGVHVSRGVRGILIRAIRAVTSDRSETQELPPEFVEKVKRLMPPQPWPPNTTESIARANEIDVQMMRLAVRRLIVSGDFYAQIDGKLFTPIADNATSSADGRNGGLLATEHEG